MDCTWPCCVADWCSHCLWLFFEATVIVSLCHFCVDVANIPHSFNTYIFLLDHHWPKRSSYLSDKFVSPQTQVPGAFVALDNCLVCPVQDQKRLVCLHNLCMNVVLSSSSYSCSWPGPLDSTCGFLFSCISLANTASAWSWQQPSIRSSKRIWVRLYSWRLYQACQLSSRLSKSNCSLRNRLSRRFVWNAENSP